MTTSHISFRLCSFGLALGLLATAPGCALIRKGAARAVGPMATQLSDGLMRQEDLDLAREGAPAFLLMLDALAESQPDNPSILLAAAEARIAYAGAFIAPEHRDRARAMYAKARDYGLQALSRRPHFARAREGSLDDFERSLQRFRRRDAHALLTTATAWVMWIIASPESPAAFGEMPYVLAMMARVHELDPEIRNGAVDLFYGIYYTVLPFGGGRDLDRAREHFERSIAIAGPDYLLARVHFAEFYARYAFDQALFEELLRDVLAAEPDAPDFTLMNTVAKRRAQDLLDLTDEYF